MSTPVRAPDDNEPLDQGRLKYAPRRARRLVHDQHEIDALIGVDVAFPRRMQEPPWKRENLPGAFPDDMAMSELRSQLAPDWIPEPPPSTVSVFAGVGWLMSGI